VPTLETIVKKTTLALCLAAFSCSAWSTEWALISETEDPEKITSWYVDTSSIVHKDDYIRALLRTSWSAPQIGPGQTAYQSSTYLNYFDCNARKIAFTANAYFTNPEPGGTPLHQEAERNLDKLQFQPVVPGSAGANRLHFVCKFRSKNFLTQRGSGLDESG
jgi:hypothetical protein